MNDRHNAVASSYTQVMSKLHIVLLCTEMLCVLPSEMTEDPSWVSGNILANTHFSLRQFLPAAITALWSRLEHIRQPHKSMVAVRQLQQSSQTFQATLTFSVSFISQSSDTANIGSIAADLSAALQQAILPVTTTSTITPDTAQSNLILNTTVAFPSGLAISATPSQGTLYAVNFTNTLQRNASQALPGLVAKNGPITIDAVSLVNKLVPADFSPSQQSPAINVLQSPTSPVAPAIQVRHHSVTLHLLFML